MMARKELATDGVSPRGGEVRIQMPEDKLSLHPPGAGEGTTKEDGDLESDEDDSDDSTPATEGAKGPAGPSASNAMPGSLEDVVIRLIKKQKTLEKKVSDLKKECKSHKKETKSLKAQLEEAETLLSAMENMNVMGNMGMSGLTIAKEHKSGAAKKDNLFNDDALFEEDADVFDLDDDHTSLWYQLKSQAERYLRQNVPLQGDLVTIESRYGKSVSFYFVFLRWVLLNYIIAGTACSLILISPWDLTSLVWSS
jgi:hypothetical protein